MDDAHLYWSWSDTGEVGVDQIAKSGGDAVTVARATGGSYLALTQDGDAIFWLHRSSTGDLVRTDVTRGEVVTLPRVELPHTLGVLEEAVYFASGADEEATVLRMLTP